MTRTAWWVFATLVSIGISRPCFAQVEHVTVSIPGSVTFSINNVLTATTGLPNPFTVSYSGAVLLVTNALRISVKANAASFTPPSGTGTIPASNITWTTSNAVGGTGSNGTLSASAFTQFYQSISNPSSGRVDITWRLAAPGTGIRAGNHTLVLTWKLESILP